MVLAMSAEKTNKIGFTRPIGLIKILNGQVQDHNPEINLKPCKTMHDNCLGFIRGVPVPFRTWLRQLGADSQLPGQDA
jgi:hypothetical protein